MAKVRIRNKTKELMPISLMRNGEIMMKYIRRGGVAVVEESELLPDTQTKADLKAIKIEKLR